MVMVGGGRAGGFASTGSTSCPLKRSAPTGCSAADAILAGAAPIAALQASLEAPAERR
jgi:hypothetical protein